MNAPEPVAIRVTRYRCPFCKNSSSRKAGIRPHIGRCWYNPDARACGTCRHCIIDPEDGMACDLGRECYEERTTTTADPDDAWREDVQGPRRREVTYHLVRQCPGWQVTA